MRAADAGRAHSLASSIVFSVFCIVSFVSISLVIIISEHTVATAVVNGGQSVWMTHGPREQRRWRGICAACACQMRQPPAGRRPASGQCLKHHIQLLTCKRVLPCESMGVAGEARARVLRACRVRGGRVCSCACAERARGRAERRRAGKAADRKSRCAHLFDAQNRAHKIVRSLFSHYARSEPSPLARFNPWSVFSCPYARSKPSPFARACRLQTSDF